MQNPSLPPALLSFLAARGTEDLSPARLTDHAALVRVFQDSVPARDSDPFSGDSLSFSEALLDCIGLMNEQLYEHYRALIDLFRAEAFRAPRVDLLACPGWDGLRRRAVSLGILPEDLFGSVLPRPHVARSESALPPERGARA